MSTRIREESSIRQPQAMEGCTDTQTHLDRERLPNGRGYHGEMTKIHCKGVEPLPHRVTHFTMATAHDTVSPTVLCWTGAV